MNEEGQVIDELFTLLGSTSTLRRDNVSYIYLSQFGNKIIPFCRKHFRTCRKADARVDFLRWVIEYANGNEEVIDFAVEALRDRNSTVRRYACLVLACSGSERAIPELIKVASSGKEPTSTEARNSIAAIRSRNWYLFHQTDSPIRSYVLPMPHNPNYPEEADVDRYIVKVCSSLVPELERILGNIYAKWEPS